MTKPKISKPNRNPGRFFEYRRYCQRRPSRSRHNGQHGLQPDPVFEDEDKSPPPASYIQVFIKDRSILLVDLTTLARTRPGSTPCSSLVQNTCTPQCRNLDKAVKAMIFISLSMHNGFCVVRIFYSLPPKPLQLSTAGYKWAQITHSLLSSQPSSSSTRLQHEYDDRSKGRVEIEATTVHRRTHRRTQYTKQ